MAADFAKKMFSKNLLISVLKKVVWSDEKLQSYRQKGVKTSGKKIFSFQKDRIKSQEMG